MKRFRKIVAIEPLGLVPEADAELKTYADEVIYCHDIPADDAEIIGRIGDADAVMLSYTSGITAGVIEKCPDLVYIGMCCSLYSPESANVDILAARERGIL